MSCGTDRYLKCSHCLAEFVPTASQWKHRHGRPITYCSTICRQAASASRVESNRPTYGPCPTCGQLFKSRVKKEFCSMACYTSSDKFKEMLKESRAKSNKSRNERSKENFEDRPCAECAKTFKVKPWKPNKYCSHLCYRKYMAKRFDRWIASPEELKLPQAYDEFLTQDDLPCLIEGCSWRGSHLAGHMQRAHGVRAIEAKRAAGFNLSTGLVSPDLHQRLCETNKSKGFAGVKDYRAPRPTTQIRSYTSNESKEHHAKAMALAKLKYDGHKRGLCKGCGVEIDLGFHGVRKFCTFECRDKFYAAEEVRPGQAMAHCGNCSKEFHINKPQKRRLAKGLKVFCCFHCRQVNNSVKRTKAYRNLQKRP